MTEATIIQIRSIFDIMHRELYKQRTSSCKFPYTVTDFRVNIGGFFNIDGEIRRIEMSMFNDGSVEQYVNDKEWTH